MDLADRLPVETPDSVEPCTGWRVWLARLLRLSRAHLRAGPDRSRRALSRRGRARPDRLRSAGRARGRRAARAPGRAARGLAPRLSGDPPLRIRLDFGAAALCEL